MTRERLDEMLAEIRAAREKTLKALADLDERAFPLPTSDARWSEVRRVLLRFGDHMREHVNQIEGARPDIGRDPTMVERILGRAEETWGLLLAATLYLEDEDLDLSPGEGEWTVYQVLDHILYGENYYRNLILETLENARDDDPWSQ